MSVPAVVALLARIRFTEMIADLFAACIIIDRMPEGDRRRAEAVSNLRAKLEETHDFHDLHAIEIEGLSWSKVRARVLLTIGPLGPKLDS